MITARPQFILEHCHVCYWWAMADSDGFPLAIIVFLCIFYSTVFIFAIVGNTWVIGNCYKTIRKKKYHTFTWLVANLACADLVFIFLTIFNIIGFFWKWVGGDNTCKLQGFLIEATYTTSISTLVVISYQRLRAVADPLDFNARNKDMSQKIYATLALIWILCFAVCSPLIFIYRVEIRDKGNIVCVNTSWGNKGRQIYYSLHGAFFFVLPLLYMIVTQTRIYRALRDRAMPRQSSSSEASNRKHKKVAKTLAALTIAFVICWSPFMITRTLIYFHLASPGLVWRASQLLICLNAALDPLLYGYFGGNLKVVLKRLLRRHTPRRGSDDVNATVSQSANTSSTNQQEEALV